MSDGDATKKARFEPPPWEREAFDALATRRAEEHAALEALHAAEAAAAAAAPAAVTKPVVDWGAETVRQPMASEANANSVQDAAAPASDAVIVPAAAPAAAAAVDEKAVAGMLLQLQAEERTDGRTTKRVGQIAAILTSVLGLGMLIAGVVMMQSGAGKQVAVIGSLVLSIFGLAFIGMAVWVWIATTRSKGRR